MPVLTPLLFRKKVRDAVKTILADPATGFNPRLAAYASAYGITAFALDFTDGSDNFAQCYVDPEKIVQSELIEFPGMTLYTLDDEDNGEPRGLRYRGDVMVVMDFYVRLREGEERNTEDLTDAVHDAALSAINDPNVAYPPGVLYTRRSKGSRVSVQPLKDGFQQLARVEAQFGSVTP